MRFERIAPALSGLMLSASIATLPAYSEEASSPATSVKVAEAARFSKQSGFSGSCRSKFGKSRGTFGFLTGQYALTDVQLEKLYEMKNKFRQEALPKMVELKNDKRQLHDLLTQAALDRTQILELQNRINAKQAALSNQRLDNKLNMLAVLSEEQRKELRKQFIKRSLGSGIHGHGGFSRRSHT